MILFPYFKAPKCALDLAFDSRVFFLWFQYTNTLVYYIYATGFFFPLIFMYYKGFFFKYCPKI